LGKNTLLYFDSEQAVRSGLAETDTILTIPQMQQYLGADANAYHIIEVTWSERIAEFLTRWYIRALLIGLFVLGFFVESTFPGTFFGGSLIVLSLALLIGAPWLIGLAHVWHIVLFFIGVGLIVLELFVIPGFGVFGIAGIAATFTGLVLMSVPTTGGGYIPLPAQAFTQQLQWSIASVFIGLILAFVVAAILRLNMKNIPLFSALILKDQQRRYTGQGPEAALPAGPIAGDEEVGSSRLSIGDIGKVTSTLRPTGTASFDNVDVDVTCPGQWIDTGKQVRITAIHGNVIEVEPV
jgi:membrane-bound serine protease (ClpP class)